MATKTSDELSGEIKFWKNWLAADTIKRRELIEKLSFVRDLEHIEKLPKKIRRQFFATLLNSYFEDLESTIYTMKIQHQ